MEQIRLSRREDIPRLQELWRLAFGDSEEYIENFFRTYYQPHRMLVLEEDGVVRAMTAWFDTTFVVPGAGNYRAAYLYAVATHPDCRGRGLAGRLLAGADEQFRGWGIPAVTTVPAEPSLHDFFGGNGFRECFTLAREAELPRGTVPAGENPLHAASPAEYGAVRERILAELPHIVYPTEALDYQAGCCALSGGGLFVGETADGPVCACAEGDGAGRILYKEVLGRDLRLILPWLANQVPGKQFRYRAPVPLGGKPCRFAMLKWLSPEAERIWNWERTAYLGLAFD